MPTVEALVLPGEGTILSVMISSTLTPIAQVYEIDGPEVAVEAIDKTALDSGVITTRPSRFPEMNNCSIKIWYDPNDNNTQAIFNTDIITPGATRSFSIEVNDANTTKATIAFDAFVTSFKLNGMKVKSNLGADIELKVASLLTITPGTP